jgi:hypothetical protein
MSGSDEYQPKKTFEVLYACQSICVGMGIEKPSFRWMSLPIEIMVDYRLFFKDKGTPHNMGNILLDNDSKLKELKQWNNKLRWVLFVELVLVDIFLFILLITK